MSVIFFDAKELGNIARVIADRDVYEDHDKALKTLAASLFFISKANAACYMYRYSEDTLPVTLSAIYKEAKALVKGDLNAAVRTVGLIRYNCEEDKDYLAEEPGALDAFSIILQSLLSAQETVMEAQTKLLAKQREQLDVLLGSNIPLD